jgi:hypothetical protein
MQALGKVRGYAPDVLIQPTEQAKYEKAWEHDDYRKVAPGEQVVFLFRDLVKPKKGETLIDFGCGTGRAGHSLAAVCKLDVTLMDFAGNCLDAEVREALDEFPDRLRFVKHDLTQPTELRAKYGFCTDVMEHLPTEQVDAVLDNIMAAVDGCFFQISCTEDHFGKVIGHPLHLTVENHDWWKERLEKKAHVRWSQDAKSHCLFYVTKARGMASYIKNLQVNTPVEVRKDQVRANMALGLPEARPHELQEREVVILAGGPSLAKFEDDIKAKRAEGMALVTVNGAYNWAIERGLKPSAQIVADPRDFNRRFVEPHVDECKYLLASVCHPDVVKAAPQDRTILWHPGPNNDVAEVLKEYDGEHFPVNGGSTVMLRGIPLLRMLGYRKFHCYGWDSCLMGDEHHAYTQDENDEAEIMTMIVGGREFKCRLWMATQAQEFIWIQKLLGDVELAVYGDGLIAHLINHYAEG